MVSRNGLLQRYHRRRPVTPLPLNIALCWSLKGVSHLRWLFGKNQIEISTTFMEDEAFGLKRGHFGGGIKAFEMTQLRRQIGQILRLLSQIIKDLSTYLTDIVFKRFTTPGIVHNCGTSVLHEEELGLSTLILNPDRLPLGYFLLEFSDPFGGPLDVVRSEVSICEVVRHIRQGLFAERVN